MRRRAGPEKYAVSNGLAAVTELELWMFMVVAAPFDPIIYENVATKPRSV